MLIGLVGQKRIHYFSLTLKYKTCKMLNRSIELLKNLLIILVRFVILKKQSIKDIKKKLDIVKLTDIKALYITIGLPHFSSQFFLNIDRIIIEFLLLLILLMQRFQISQLFIYL